MYILLSIMYLKVTAIVYCLCLANKLCIYNRDSRNKNIEIIIIIGSTSPNISLHIAAHDAIINTKYPLISIKNIITTQS